MEKSSGGVIFRNNQYLVLRYGWGHWGFVKGKIENGETDKETFLRESKEESGLSEKNLKIITGFKETINYYYRKSGKTIYKQVVYHLAESNTFDITLSHEHKDYKWLKYTDALELISFKNDKNILKKAEFFLEKTK